MRNARAPIRLAVALVFVVIGCGGGDDSSPATTSGDAAVSGDAAIAFDGASPASDGGDGGGTPGDGGAADSGDSGNGGPGPGPTQMCAFTKDAAGFFKLTSPKSDYWVRLPPNYNVQTPQPTALLVAIHGCGDTAYNFATWGAVPAALRTSQDYIAISLGGRESACWMVPQDNDIVTAAIAHVRSCFYVHQKKVVLAGYSSGGMLAYELGMKSAASFAGILIEHSGLSQGVGGNNVDSVLANAAWKINVAHTAHTEDMSFAIAGVRSDRDKMIAAGFPLQYREGPGDHNGSSDDWALYLIPKMANWTAP